MKTRQQREYEARLRAQIRAEMQGPYGEDHLDALAEERAFNERMSAVHARVDERGERLPCGEYRAAAEHHFAHREARRSRHPRTLAAHPSSPVAGTDLYTRECEREGCEEHFVTAARQRQFCSETCARKDQRAQAAAKRARYEAATIECARTGCTERYFSLRPDHRYCSARCRDRARIRTRTQHPARPCESCEKDFVPKNVRARFCSDRCRVRVWGRRKADRDAPTQPIPVQRPYGN